MTSAAVAQTTGLPDTDVQLIESLIALSDQAPDPLKQQLSQKLLVLKKEIDGMRAANTTMAEAQAKALVNSAMVMSELKETHRELDKARSDAVSASTAKSEFLANMSHEIRTPINGVLGMNEILLRSDLSSTQRRCATVIRNSVEALLQIINDILDFSKIEAGKFELVASPFNLRDVVEDVVQLFAENAQRKRLELNVVADAGAETHFIGDAGRIRQVLANLVGNAIKFTESGEIIVRFDTSSSADGKACHAHFEVEDTGIGIEPHVQSKIFESFTQADSSTERRFGGTGLGLSICSQLVQLMDGQIAVKSNPAAGSNFYFDIQLQPDLSNREHVDNDVEQLKNVKILAVDDTETNRIIYGDQLNHWQCDFALASSGPEALRLLEEAHDAGAPFEIIILDMHMPEMDGLNLARKITQDPRNKNLTRIMLSSIGDQLSQTIDPSVNIHIYMTKPVRYRELQDCLCDVKAGRVSQGFNFNDLESQKFSGHVLVAEDNLVNQEVAIDLLELNNMTVDAVANGLEAVEAFRTKNYDLIFMDCQMPQLDGFGATEEIRDLERKENSQPTPIIALTAFALDGDREKCLDAGMDDYLQKPFTDAALQGMLAKWINLASTETTPNLVQPEKPAPQSEYELPIFAPAAMERFEQREQDGKKGIIKKIIGGYIQQSDEYVSELESAAESIDLQSIAFASHALKSSSLLVGGEALSEICRELEISCKSQSLADPQSSIRNLLECYQMTRSALMERYGSYL